MVVSTRPGENMEDSGPTADRPDVDCEMCHPTLAVTDVRAAIEFYTTKLGFWVAFAEADPPTFAGVNLGRVQIFLEHGTPAPEGCSVYFVVSDGPDDEISGQGRRESDGASPLISVLDGLNRSAAFGRPVDPGKGGASWHYWSWLLKTGRVRAAT